MNEQQQELNERIADDERHAATMRKARDYDALMARAEAADARAEQFRRDYNGLYDDYHELCYRSADIRVALHAARQRVDELEAPSDAPGWRSSRPTPSK